MAGHGNRPGAPRPASVLALHGLGLGPWAWASCRRLLERAGLPIEVADWPSDGGLEEVLGHLEERVRALPAPVAVIGHSAGGLVAQLLAARVELGALAVVSGVPPANVRWWPTPAALALLRPVPVAQLVLGRAVRPGFSQLAATTLAGLPEPDRVEVARRLEPLPGRLVRELVLHRPRVTSAPCPTLVAFGLLDPLVRPETHRLVGDLHDAVIWRFDDVGHLPLLEPAGGRLLQAVVEWLSAPHGRRIRDIEPFAPAEGVGAEERRRRALAEAGPSGRPPTSRRHRLRRAVRGALDAARGGREPAR